ncbi:MAG TPA: GNAT family N-acetyltransferase [Ignavibacteria bacterium]|nr:GNAT family N-acetyltransferase [Ignavibacteria bacterium]
MLKLVKNESKYFEFIRNLRNDEEVSKGFIKQEYITNKQQERYMQKYGSYYYICLEDEIPVGYIGQIDKDIRLAVLPGKQGKGIGKFMVNSFVKLFPDIYAKVKLDNTASLNLFKSCGFKEKYIILEPQ